MNIELFDKAVEFIASLSDSQLDLGSWQHTVSSENSEIIEATIAQSSEEVTCGTIACAAGWLALSADFNALGLHPNPSGCPVFESNTAYHSMRVLFDISYGDAMELFAFRSGSDSVRFGRDMSNLMTDRQLWLSRARILRAYYMARVEKPNNFRSKSVEVEAFTFEEIIEAGKQVATSIVNGIPWSFTFRGCPVTHERDDWYLITTNNGAMDLVPGKVLVIGPEGAQVMSEHYFEQVYERI